MCRQLPVLPSSQAALRLRGPLRTGRESLLELDASLYRILQILSVSLFEKTPILCALQAIDGDAKFAENINQLILFDF